MNYRNEMYKDTFDDIENSGVVDGMSKRNRSYNLRKGIDILNTYDAKEEEPYPTGGCGHIVFGTTIPLNMDDKERLFNLGWYENYAKWPPQSESVEQYGFNTIKCNV